MKAFLEFDGKVGAYFSILTSPAGVNRAEFRVAVRWEAASATNLNEEERKLAQEERSSKLPRHDAPGPGPDS